MSKIGRQPVSIPESVKISESKGTVKVFGPKGTLELQVRPEVRVEIKDNQVVVTIKKQDKLSRGLYGLTRSLIANMVIGVTEGFEKTLVLEGTGYRVHQQGKNLKFSLGFSHEIDFEAPEGIEIKAEDQKKVIVSGIDKEKVGQVAANIRDLRPPEPYKGKGIRYEGEKVRRKAGKQVKTAE